MNTSIFSPIPIAMITTLVVIGIIFSYVAYTTYTASHPQFIAPNNSTTGLGWGFIYKTLKAYGWKPCPPAIKHPEALCSPKNLGNFMINSTLPVPLDLGTNNQTTSPLPQLTPPDSAYPLYNQTNQYVCPNSTGVLCIGPHLSNQSVYFVPTSMIHRPSNATPP